MSIDLTKTFTLHILNIKNTICLNKQRLKDLVVKQQFYMEHLNKRDFTTEKQL